MGFKINVTSETGSPATYAKLAKLTIENADKQYISAVFQLYSSKKTEMAKLV